MTTEAARESERDLAGVRARQARSRGSTRALVALLAFVLGFATVPHRVCERDATKWFSGDPAKTDGLGRGIERWMASDLAAGSFETGSSRFDEEWLFTTYVMAAMGFGQVALERGDAKNGDALAKAELLTRMEACLDALLDPQMRAFEGKAWDGDALASVDAAPGSASDRGHVAYLGHAGLALALHRYLKPASRFADREEAIVRALARRIAGSKTGFVETYPGEVYPVDNAAALAALAVHARTTHADADVTAALARGLDTMRAHGVDPGTGLVIQSVGPSDARPVDAPRASGTALSAYFLGYADPATSRALFRALERGQFRTVLGFGGMMEYPLGRRGGPHDVASGPILLGFGVSASGFAIGAARAHGDLDMFRALYASAHLFGAPLDGADGTRTYVVGGPLGDAILFAMFTAPRAGRFS